MILQLSAEMTEGYTVALVGYSIVFLALVAMIIVFTNIPRLLKLNLKRKLEKEGKVVKADSLNIDGNVNAAIAMAIHMYFDEMHDEESGVITIQKVKKSYSPWSSKIYGVLNQPSIRR
ncbi:MAG: OadG family protein [Marinifilaceae bacterium]|jgi:Na+-transporting methylmalonyl-CoA/oxaloacetate decarboxylase gamma subunit